MKFLKFLLALVIVCFACTADATSDPPDQNQGITIIIDQDFNCADIVAVVNLNISDEFENSYQFRNPYDVIMEIRSKQAYTDDYCYISRHRRTTIKDFLLRYNIRLEDTNSKMAPLIRGHDSKFLV